MDYKLGRNQWNRKNCTSPLASRYLSMTGYQIPNVREQADELGLELTN